MESDDKNARAEEGDKRPGIKAILHLVSELVLESINDATHYQAGGNEPCSNMKQKVRLVAHIQSVQCLGGKVSLTRQVHISHTHQPIGNCLSNNWVACSCYHHQGVMTAEDSCTNKDGGQSE